MDTANEMNGSLQPNNDGERTPDLFEDLRALLGCEFISDLKFLPWNDQALRLTSRMKLTRYSLHALSDLYHYLTGKHVSFDDHEQARQCFHGEVLSARPHFDTGAEFA